MIFLSYFWISVGRDMIITISFLIQLKKGDWLKFYRLSGATLYDCINNIYQFIKSFFYKNVYFLRDMEPLRQQTGRNTKKLRSEPNPPTMRMKSKSDTCRNQTRPHFDLCFAVLVSSRINCPDFVFFCMAIQGYVGRLIIILPFKRLVTINGDKGARQTKMCLLACAKGAVSHHPTHAPSITRDIAHHSYILQYPMILLADSQGPVRLRGCAGWSGPSLSAYAWGHIFEWRGSNCLKREYPAKFAIIPDIVNQPCVAFGFFFLTFTVYKTSRQKQSPY